MIGEDRLKILNEANYGRKLAIAEMAKLVEADPEATVTVEVYQYLQALQLVVNDVDELLKLLSSTVNAIDIIKDSSPPSYIDTIIEAAEREPECYFHDIPLAIAMEDPCCDGCAEGEDCEGCD